jgi:hypothetical protein
LLAGGGVLALGLGVVVVANMEDEDTVVPSTPTVAKITPLPTPVIPKTEPVVPHPEPTVIPHHAPTPHPIHVKIPDEVQEATSVSDDQTFKEAFDAARHELGPGHIFEWHGTVYNTFTASELHGMTNEQHQQWGEHYTEFIANHITPDPLPSLEDNHIAINTFEHFSWTGVDKNGDGILEVLIAKGEGNSPIVWADTDNDGKMDTRFDYDASTGNLMSSEMPPETYSIDLVNNLPELEHLQIPEESQIYHGNYSIEIEEMDENFKVSIASNDEHNVDIVALHQEGKDPILIVDADGDGHLETLYGYDHNFNHVASVPLDNPLDLIVFNQESTDENGEHPLIIDPPNSDENSDHFAHESNHFEQDTHFNNHDEVVAHDFDIP